jgi:beta-glucosidase
VGYRYYEASGTDPLFAFGHGLTYGDVVWEDVTVEPGRVTVSLWNRGTRRGTEVVQVYRRAGAHHELAGFVKVGLDPGQRELVQVAVDAAADPSEFLVGASSRDIRSSL